MFGFIKKMLTVVVTFFSFNVLSVNSLKCVSFSSQRCGIRPKIMDVNNDEPVFPLLALK